MGWATACRIRKANEVSRWLCQQKQKAVGHKHALQTVIHVLGIRGLQNSLRTSASCTLALDWLVRGEAGRAELGISSPTVRSSPASYHHPGDLKTDPSGICDGYLHHWGGG